jgi:hypothetical protein
MPTQLVHHVDSYCWEFVQQATHHLLCTSAKMIIQTDTTETAQLNLQRLASATLFG